MLTIYSKQRWTSKTPPIYFTLEYESQRSGRDMQYRFKLTIPALGRDSMGQPWYFYYTIVPKIFLDGTQKATNTWNFASTGTWSSSLTWTTSWLTVTNKFSGTTALKLEMGSSSGRSASYSYSLPIVSPGSSLTVPSSFQLMTAVPITITTISADAATHDLVLTANGSSQVIAQDLSAGSHSVNPSITFLGNAFPNSSTGLTIWNLRTYNASGEIIGEYPVEVTADLSSIKPAFGGFTITVPSGYGGKAVQGKTAVEAVVTNPRGTLGSSVVSCTITCEDVVTDNLTASFTPKGTGTISVTAKVTDSRGQSTSIVRTFESLEYHTPQVSLFRTFRADATGARKDLGTYCGFSIKASVSSLDGYNNSVISLDCLQSDDPEDPAWGNFKTYSGQYTLDLSGVSSYEVMSGDHTYDTRIVVRDSFTSVVVYGDSIPTTFTLMDFHESGHGMAIGKIAESADLFEVDLPAKFNRGIIGFSGAITGTIVSASFSSGVASVSIEGATAGCVVMAQRVATANDTSGNYSTFIAASRCNTDGTVKLYLNNSNSATYSVFVLYQGEAEEEYENAMGRDY